jgi:hypothetical protein
MTQLEILQPDQRQKGAKEGLAPEVSKLIRDTELYFVLRRKLLSKVAATNLVAAGAALETILAEDHGYSPSETTRVISYTADQTRLREQQAASGNILEASVEICVKTEEEMEKGSTLAFIKTELKERGVTLIRPYSFCSLWTSVGA